MPPVSVVELFPEERGSLLDLLSGLSDTEWAAPTICAGWSVHDLARHLLADLDQDTAWRRFTRGLSKEEIAGRVRLEGDPVLTNAMLDMVAIIA